MNSIWRPTLTLLVLNFGLVSCAPDQLPGQQPAAPEAIKDSWVLTKPYIQRGGKISLMNVGDNADDNRVLADAALVFPSLQGRQGDGVTLELTVTCSQNGKRTQHQSTVRNAHILPLKALIPTTHLASSDVLECALTGTATNAIGSRHSFALEKLRIVELSRIFDSAALDSQIAATAAHSALNLGKSAEARLVCEHFENIRMVHAFSGQDIYKDLIEGPLVWREPPSLSPNGDPRQVLTRQRCQVVFESLDATTGLKHRWISAPSLVRFPPPKPLISGRQTLGQADSATFATHSVFEVAITNPTREPIRFAAPTHLPQVLELAMVFYNNPSNSIVFPSFVESLHVSVSGAQVEIAAAGGEEVMFTVAPGETAILAARLQSNLRCRVSAPAGFAFRFLRSFELAMLVNVDNQGTIERIPMPWPIEMPMGSHAGTPDGWIPRDQWMVQVGTQARPVLTPDNRKVCARPGEHLPF